VMWYSMGMDLDSILDAFSAPASARSRTGLVAYWVWLVVIWLILLGLREWLPANVVAAVGFVCTFILVDIAGRAVIRGLAARRARRLYEANNTPPS
jgi:hypothetical protein